MLAAYAAAALVLAGSGLLASLTGTPARELTQDPAHLADAPAYRGFLSHLGVLCWAAGAAVCLFTWFAIGRRPAERAERRFFAACGVLLSLFALDDLFQLHELVADAFGPLRERHFFMLYAVAGVIVALRLYRTPSLHRLAPLLASAGVLVAFSVLLDGAAERWTSVHDFWEEAPKLLGAVGALATLTLMGRHALGRGETERRAVGEPDARASTEPA